MVGMSIAYGLARAGEKVQLLDEGDDAFRAARGNFGLVWVHGKGLGSPDYARWSQASARDWPSFSRDLAARTGVDVELSQIGGMVMSLDERELSARVADLSLIRESLGGDYPYEVLDDRQVRALEPGIGPDVVGATFGPLDGHVSPLRLLQALHLGFKSAGGDLTSGNRVQKVEYRAGAFHVYAGSEEHVCGRLVLAAGLGNKDLAPMVGLRAPVVPSRGQILVTERMQPFLKHPSMHVRQTGEGVIQIGDSKEDVGFDDGTTVDQLATIAKRATRLFPLLRGVNVVRTWGALRVMTADGFPVYEASTTCPGAFVVTCHSGITLAAIHAGPLADWIRGGPEPIHIKNFKAERFDV
ncbi:MAG: FAD-binding oxidoreductase [Alcaligenaceae bacterium]|nr:MAG: FAD-binding oxidoreductase [Alcaligenaceae bacterium]